MFLFVGGPRRGFDVGGLVHRAARSVGGLRRRVRRVISAVGVTCTAVVLDVSVAWGQATTVPGGGGGGYNPDPGQGPGGPQLQQLVNWAAGLILIACGGMIAFHAGRWGWGSQQHNMAKVQDGKEGVARSATVAGVIAAAAGLIKFATGLGGAIK